MSIYNNVVSLIIHLAPVVKPSNLAQNNVLWRNLNLLIQEGVTCAWARNRVIRGWMDASYCAAFLSEDVSGILLNASESGFLSLCLCHKNNWDSVTQLWVPAVVLDAFRVILITQIHIPTGTLTHNNTTLPSGPVLDQRSSDELYQQRLLSRMNAICKMLRHVVVTVVRRINQNQCEISQQQHDNLLRPGSHLRIWRTRLIPFKIDRR